MTSPHLIPPPPKPGDLFDDHEFVWPLPAGGYRWVDAVASSPDGEVMTRMLTARDGILFRQVSVIEPLTATGAIQLFRVFAAVLPTEAGALHFANRYGLLTTGEVFKCHSDECEPFPLGESLAQWSSAISELRRAIDLWDAIEDIGSEKRLSDTVVWNASRNEWELHRWRERYKRFIREKSLKAARHGLKAGDRTLAARYFLQGLVNDRLREGVSPVVLWNAGRSEHVVRIKPKTLLGAMWWQFARAISGEIRGRSCKVCSVPMEISGAGRRGDSLFCSNKCRQQDHRNKVKEARAMRTAKMSIASIAKHFSTDRETINGWINPKRK